MSFGETTRSGDQGAEITRRVRELAASLPDRISMAVPLRDLTTFRIGGPAVGYCAIQTPRDAIRFQSLAAARELPVAILGGGSNVLADDRGFCGLVMKMAIASFSVAGPLVTAGAGMVFDDLIARTLTAGLVGLEFASGIPGTVGGAIVGNAGCFGHEMSEFVERARVLRPDGTIAEMGPLDLDFAYRNSALKRSRDILLDVDLRLCSADPAPAWRDRTEKTRLRWDKHPREEPSAGSYFQNLTPETPGGRRCAAGELLERAGAKGWSVGGAAVYHKHANIIINTGGATCQDVLELAARMKAAVQRMFGIELQEEVRYLPWCHPIDTTTAETGTPSQP
jgi:UDP-N-acetylmuramate dehydrogenase